MHKPTPPFITIESPWTITPDNVYIAAMNLVAKGWSHHAAVHDATSIADMIVAEVERRNKTKID